MYSIDLERITLDDFRGIITSIDLSPGRRILLENLSEVIGRLKQEGIPHVAALRDTLKKKSRYARLAEEVSVSPEYLAVLNREVNSYVSKPVPLSKLEVFSSIELERLERAGLKSTKDLYEQCLTRTSRQRLSKQCSLTEEKLVEALELSELLRINGVGLVYARILRESGIRSASAYLETDSREILKRYQKVKEQRKLTSAKLGMRDVEYCKRFCRLLDAEVEW